ncbi:MAG: twin-arginine translocation pathway signal protein [Pseudomonadota bacterium]
MPSRRTFLAGLGGLVVTGAVGGTVFAFTRTPAAALAPWAAPGTAYDPRVRALEWAVLAPNPHNRQPWLVALEDDDSALIYCDLDRRLPMTDPFDRQITIGLGCFVELFALAAGSEGFAVNVTPFPEGEPANDGRLDERPVARLTLTRSGVAADPLFAAVPDRRSNKEPYDPARPVPASALQPVAAAAKQSDFAFTVAPARTAVLRDLVQRAWDVEAITPRTHQESVDLMRIGKSEIEASPDGIDLGGAMLETLNMVGVLTRETLADPESQAFAQGKTMYRELFDTTQGFIWQSTPGNSRAEQLAAGRDWLRINLALTLAGIAVQPLSQPLQEYPEMAALYREAQETLGVDGTVQMLARIGYGPDVPPSPRWPARAKLM